MEAGWRWGGGGVEAGRGVVSYIIGVLNPPSPYYINDQRSSLRVLISVLFPFAPLPLRFHPLSPPQRDATLRLSGVCAGTISEAVPAGTGISHSTMGRWLWTCTPQ